MHGKGRVMMGEFGNPHARGAEVSPRRSWHRLVTGFWVLIGGVVGAGCNRNSFDLEFCDDPERVVPLEELADDEATLLGPTPAEILAPFEGAVAVRMDVEGVDGAFAGPWSATRVFTRRSAEPAYQSTFDAQCNISVVVPVDIQVTAEAVGLDVVLGTGLLVQTTVSGGSYLPQTSEFVTSLSDDYLEQAGVQGVGDVAFALLDLASWKLVDVERPDEPLAWGLMSPVPGDR